MIKKEHKVDMLNQKKNIDKIYRYYEFVTYLMVKDAFCYPNANYGNFISREEVLKAWKQTVNLIKVGMAPPNFFIYIHIPFCESACFYCMSFSLGVKKRGDFINKYLQSIYSQMEYFSPILKELKVYSVYIGGGTPSLLTDFQIKNLIYNLRKFFNMEYNRSRIIFEASPFTLNHQKLNLLKELNIYELSLGIQSFDQKVLNKNRRPQRVDHSIDIINYAKKIKFPAISIDIMVGMPYQSPGSALDSVKKAIMLDCDGIHINEFLPLEFTRFCLEGNKYTYEDILQKKETRRQVRSLLKNAKYISTPEDYRKTWSNEDEERAYRTQEINNLLGLGYGSYSHAFGSLKYQLFYPFAEFVDWLNIGDYLISGSGMNVNTIFSNKLIDKYNQSIKIKKRKTPFKYIGLKMDISREMHAYAYTKIGEVVYFSEFMKKFNSNFIRIFNNHLKILSLKNLIKVYSDRIELLKTDPVHKQIIRTFFIDKVYIQEVIDISKEKYSPDKDYKRLIYNLTR